jgi:hypothetical protein
VIGSVAKASAAAQSIDPVHNERTKFTFRFVTRYTKDCSLQNGRRMGGEIWTHASKKMAPMSTLKSRIQVHAIQNAA